MHHPHVHMIVPGGGISPDGSRWIRGSAKFLLPVRVLSALFRRRMLEALAVAHKAGKLIIFNDLASLADATAFADSLEPLKAKKWHVYAKRPFGGPQAVLAYLARYTHRVAISNRRLIRADAHGVTFKFKDYRIDGPGRYKTMIVHPHEFIRRVLIHVLPKGFHRIRHTACPGQVGSPTRAGGLLATGQRADNIERARELIGRAEPPNDTAEATVDKEPGADLPPCPCCGARLRIIEIFLPGETPMHRPSPRPCPCCGARMLIIETFEGVCRPRPHAHPSRTMTRIDTS